MDEPNTIETKLDFLVEDTKKAKIYCDNLDRERERTTIVALATLSILFLLLAFLIGWVIGYDAGVSDAMKKITQSLVLGQFGIHL